jgi:hypothetical protein
MNKLFVATQLVAAFIAASTFAPSAEAANPLGPKPTCAFGMIAKVENNMWVCRPLTLTSAQQNDPTANGLPQKPRCRIGLVAQWEFGGWVCKELPIAPAQVNDPTAAQSQKPTCAPGKLPKMENGQWVCKTPDITSKPPTESTLLLPAIQKVREAAAR